MQGQDQEPHFAIAVKKAADGGFIIMQWERREGEEEGKETYAAARTTLPEVTDWFAKHSQKVFGELAYVIQPPAPPMRQMPPMPPHQRPPMHDAQAMDDVTLPTFMNPMPQTEHHGGLVDSIARRIPTAAAIVLAYMSVRMMAGTVMGA